MEKSLTVVAVCAWNEPLGASGEGTQKCVCNARGTLSHEKPSIVMRRLSPVTYLFIFFRCIKRPYTVSPLLGDGKISYPKWMTPFGFSCPSLACNFSPLTPMAGESSCGGRRNTSTGNTIYTNHLDSDEKLTYLLRKKARGSDKVVKIVLKILFIAIHSGRAERKENQSTWTILWRFHRPSHFCRHLLHL